MAFKNNSYFKALHLINAILNEEHKKTGILMLFLLLLNAFIDVAGVAFIYPLIDATLNVHQIDEVSYLKNIYEFIGIEDKITFLLVLSLIVLIVILLKNILSIGILYFQSKYCFDAALDLSRRMFQYYYSKGYSFITGENSGTYLHHIQEVPFLFADRCFMSVFIISTEIVVVLFVIIIMLFSVPSILLLLALIIVPVYTLIYGATKRGIYKIGVEKDQLNPVSRQTLLESIKAYIHVKLHGKEQQFIDRYLTIQKSIYRLDALSVGYYQKIPQKIYDLVLILGVIVVLVLAVFFKNDNQHILSILSIFALVAYRCVPSFSRIMNSLMWIRNHMPSVVHLNVLKDWNEPSITSNERIPLDFFNKIAFNNVSFKYPNQEQFLLDECSWSVKKGEIVGIMGVSGSGKTTFLHLFLRLLQQNSGEIMVDGIGLNSKALDESFQRKIAYVGQDIFILDASLSENITFGEKKELVDSKRVIDILKQVNLQDLLEDHKTINNLLLGENGANLSGGQRQRIAIARALYQQAEIFVFDEATSSLDLNTEQIIIEQIKKLQQLQKTIIIVSHKPNPLKICDKIYTLEKGKIVNTVNASELTIKRTIS